jgi:TPR repeat protein/serine/threonine protein kinase
LPLPPEFADQEEMFSVQTEEPRRFRRGDLIVRRYRVIAELGQGRLGVVYRCLDQVTGLEVALKSLPAEVFRDPVGMDEVRENFRWVSRLVHQHVVAVRTLEQDSVTGASYLVLECVEGRDLRQWRLQRGGKVPLEEALPILRQVATALDFAHGQKILHRDLKPSKVLVRADGTVKVLFFGLAAQAQSALYPASRFQYHIKRVQHHAGPQKWRGQYQGAGTDQFALAVIAYEVLAGKLPFGLTYPAVMHRGGLLEGAVRPEGLDAAVWSVLARGLARENLDRFGSCAEFVAELAGRPPAEVVREMPGVRVAETETREVVEGGTPAISRALRLGGKSAGDEIAAVPEERPEPASPEIPAEHPVESPGPQIPERPVGSPGLQALERPVTSPGLPLLEALVTPADLQPPEAPTRPPELKEADRPPDLEVPEPGALPTPQASTPAPVPSPIPAPSSTTVPPAEPSRPLAEPTRPTWGRTKSGRVQARSAWGHTPSAWARRGLHTRARELGRKAARHSRAVGLGVLGVLLVVGLGAWYSGRVREEAGRRRAELAKQASRGRYWYLKAPLRELEAEAVRTNVAALVELGDRYCWGLVGRVAYQAALKWYGQAADLKEPVAYGRMGNLCQDAPALTGGQEEMMRWYEQGAVLGDAISQIDWGNAIRKGNAGSEPPETAQRLFTVAIPRLRELAAVGDTMAMDYLGGVYWDGLGVPQDPSEAVKWFRQAAILGNSSAMNHLGLAYDRGRGVTTDHAEARKWFRQAAELGDGAAMYNLAYAYAQSNESPGDQVEAANWMSSAADLGLAPAMSYLGLMYANGTGVPQDDKEAWAWFQKAAAAGNADAMTWLGRFCETGRGFGVDYEAALKWYRKAAALGDLRSKLRLNDLNITEGAAPSLNALK